MKKDNKKEPKFLKFFFSNTKNSVSFLVSLGLTLTLSIIVLSSFFLSDLTLEKLASSKYFQNRVTEVLEDNKISSEGIISIKFNNFSSGTIIIEKARLLNFNSAVGYEISLKVDFMKYWLGLTFIDEMFIKSASYSPPDNVIINLDKIRELDLKIFTQSMDSSLNNITSKSIYIEEGTIKFQNQIYSFNNISIVKNEKLITTESSMSFRPIGEGSAFSATVYLSLNEENVLTYNIKSQDLNYNELFDSKNIPRIVSFFLNKLVPFKTLSEEKINEIMLVGNYDLNSTTINLEISDLFNRFKFNSRAKFPKTFKDQTILFEEIGLILGEYAIEASNFKFNFVDRSFETNVTKVLMPFENSSVFPNKFKVFGIFPFGEETISKINILGENPSHLKASLEILEPINELDNKQASLDFFVKVDALRKISLNKLGFSLDMYSRGEDEGISVYDADAQISVKFGNKNVELNLFEGKINNLVYFQNNKPLVEFESIDFKGNLKQGYAAINSVTKIELSKNIYRDIKLEFSSTGDTDYVKEITLSFKSTISDLIPLAPKAKYDLTWINSLVRSQEEKEVEITLSKAIAFDNIENFFTPEENIFELKVKNLLIPLSNRNSINLGILNVKGAGNTIFFEGSMAGNNKKISGSINNWLFNASSGSKANNLIIFFDNLNSQTFFPNLSTLNILGPVKLTFLPVGNKDNISFQSNVDLTNADVYVPALALKKERGIQGQFQFNFTKDNKSNFKYSQKDVLVSGTAFHKSFFEIKKIDYSQLKTPDILIEGATFQRFGEYNQFKTNKGTISLEFLMRLSFKKKDVPLDLIFSDIAMTYKRNQFIDSFKGEIRSFNGLRGYAKAKLSKNSDLEIIIKPYKNHSINMVISGNNAGELLRRGQYYKNGYGGLFKASVFYKNRTKVSGSLEIEELRIKNAPVLAQIISSASIVGLLDNLNGNGLLFTRIEGSFDYNDGELALKDGVAVGPSLGLTMAGYERYGKKQNTVNVNGLVSPVYIINGVVKAIPLIGELLGGEKGEGVFGVSYKVQGNSSNPRVLVNPLSILTPGIFRKIFNIQENVNR